MDGLYIMEIPIKMDDLGGKTHYFWKHPYQLIANLKKNDSSIRNAKNLPIGREHSWGTMTSYKSTTHDKQTSGAGRFYSTIVLFFFLLEFNPYGSPQFTGISDYIEKDPPRNCMKQLLLSIVDSRRLTRSNSNLDNETFRARRGSRSTRLVCRERAYGAIGVS